MKRSDIKGRFLALVTKSDSGCWEWSGHRWSNDYGAFKINYKHYLAHRISYRLFVGPIPDGLFVLHHCDNKACVNPDHLFLGTQLDNMRDKVSKGRQQRGTEINCAKLNEKAVREIRSLYGKDGWNYYNLGERYGVRAPTVEDVVKGISWEWVE